LQPQRFSEVIYFGLQPENVRLRILETHALRVSRELGKQLFSSDEEREEILNGVAKATESFTPRYLSDICTQAKTFLLQRVAQSKGRKVGLTEIDLDTVFTIGDWGRAVEEVRKKYDKEAVVKRDKELKKFAEHYNQPIGFVISPNEHVTPLEEIIYRARANNKKGDSQSTD